ncbi:UbiA family prenyltransferase [Halovenus marina]|uniref:UbiA family prenyltransferase n=1 Tax=Halovenus marina TaxID=3396621 RepID=UPI003F5464FD
MTDDSNAESDDPTSGSAGVTSGSGRHWSGRTVRAYAVATVLALVHSNVLISLSAASVVVTTVGLADLQLEVLPVAIVFAVTVFVYSFNRLADRAEDETNVPSRTEFIDQHGRALLAAGIALYASATVLAILSEIPGAPAMILPLLVAVLYSTVGLKRLFLVKNLLVGLSWGLIPLGVGVYYDALLTADILFLFGFVTVMLTIAAAVFDIKDIEGDRQEGIRSVPIVLGPAWTRRLAAAATLLVAVVVFGAIFSGLLPERYAVLFGFLAYIFSYCLFATEDRTTLFYGFVIDSEHILLACLVVLWDAFAV